VGQADDDFGYEEEWMYADLATAYSAFSAWDPLEEPEPERWTRHMPSCRRRPDGDPAREYVAP
jgi:hypothetical protein